MSSKLLSALILFCFILSTSGLAEEFGRFEGRLILEDVAADYVNTGPSDPGHTEFKLLTPYSFIDSNGEKWTAPSDIVVNGASIPQVAWSIIGGPWSGEHRNAAVIHDYLCAELISSSAKVHRLFYDGLRANGVSKAKAKAMYYAVLVGGPDWDEGANFAAKERGNITEEELDRFLNSPEIDSITLEELEQRAASLRP